MPITVVAMPTLTAPTATPSLQDALIAALEGDDPESAMEQAFMQLGRGANIALLLTMIKAMVRIGIGGLAVKLLRSSSGLLAAEPQLAALAEQLERAPSGAIPTHELTATFQKNINAISKVSDTAQSTEAEALRQFAVFRSRKGNYFIVRENQGNRLAFAFHPSNQCEQARKLQLSEVSLATAYLLVGVPNVPTWNRLVEQKTAQGYCPPIDVIETEVVIASLWLGLVDVSAELKSGRLSLFIGSDAVAQCRASLGSHPARSNSCECLQFSRPNWQPPVIDRRFYKEAESQRMLYTCKIHSQLAQCYESKDAPYWRKRFECAGISQPPLKIVGFTSRYSTVMQHAMRDIACAFRAIGCEFHIAMQPNSHTANVDVAGVLQQHLPDLAFVINHLRTEFGESVPANIPYVCWIQDYMQLLWNRKAGESVGRFDLVLGHSPDVMTSVYGYPRDQFIGTSNLTSPAMFCDEPVPAADRAPYECDVSYVANGWETPEALIAQMAGASHDTQRLLSAALAQIRRLLDQQGCVTTQNLVTIALNAEQESSHRPLTPEQRRSVIVPAVQRLIDRAVRHQTIEWTARWAIARNRTFKLFGQGWDQHPKFRPFACGTVEHGYPLRCLYQASRINLQINAYSALHQRLLDGLASGGFVLSRYVPGDFIRQPFEYIRSFISARGIENLPQLLKAATEEEQLQHAIKTAEQLTGTRIAPANDAERRRHVQAHVECASLDPAMFTDSGLYQILRDGIGVPGRSAADLPHFEQTTFRTEAHLHKLLDRFVDNPDARNQIARPMRESVLAHDTYDQLAKRILTTFRSQLADHSCAC